MSDAEEILFERRGNIAIVTLNRPKALNALTHDMCVALKARLDAWAMDAAVHAVVIRGAGEKAFCAGGDIRKLYEEGRAGSDYPARFYGDEYRLNAAIHHFPKPYIALIDGFVMGGGVGVSVHGSHRVVGENVKFAMPETGIGLFPDVGGSYFLPRLPHRLGMYLGLTGARFGADDCLYAGLADAIVPAERFDELIDALAANPLQSGHAVSAIVASFAREGAKAPIADHEKVIEDCFSLGSVEGIIEALQAGNDWAQKQAEIILSKSPTSLKLTFRQIREGAGLDFDDCMRMEWRMVCHVMRGHDFYEGTRAVVIDRDNAPKWCPASLEEVDDAEIDRYFQTPQIGELRL